MRGDVYRLSAPRDARGHEQDGPRYAVVVQSDDVFPWSTVLVAPTSTRAWATSFRPQIGVNDVPTFVLTDQVVAADPGRLGDKVGRLSHEETLAVDDALRIVMGLL